MHAFCVAIVAIGKRRAMQRELRSKSLETYAEYSTSGRTAGSSPQAADLASVRAAASKERRDRLIEVIVE
jgi:hypothetical protein